MFSVLYAEVTVGMPQRFVAVTVRVMVSGSGNIGVFINSAWTL